MRLIKRLRYLWKISGQEITQMGYTPEGRVFHAFGEPNQDNKPRMAQIIKRTTPTAEFLKEVPQNEPT